LFGERSAWLRRFAATISPSPTPSHST
jgi:hypothetical protein